MMNSINNINNITNQEIDDYIKELLVLTDIVLKDIILEIIDSHEYDRGLVVSANGKYFFDEIIKFPRVQEICSEIIRECDED